MQPLDFPLVGGWPVAGGLERPRRLVLKLLLPGVYLVGVHLITLGQVGHRRLLSQRLQRNLRFQRRIDPSSRPLSHRPLRLIRNGAFSNYAPGPIFRVHFRMRRRVTEREPSGFHCITSALSTIANRGSVRTTTALTVLKTRYATKVEGPNIIYRVAG